MRRVQRTLTAAAVAVLLVGGAAACSSDATSSNDGASTTTTTASKSFEITTADGQVSVSLDGNLPPGWPDTFPVPDGASPAGSGSLVNGGTGKLVGVFTGSLSPQDAYDFYKSSTAYTVGASSSVGAGSAYLGSVQFSGSYAGRVTIVSKGGSTTIVAVIDAGSDATTDGTRATVAP